MSSRRDEELESIVIEEDLSPGEQIEKLERHIKNMKEEIKQISRLNKRKEKIEKLEKERRKIISKKLKKHHGRHH